MAELNIGKHCEIKSCHQEDFLPFVCDTCSGVFCLDHRTRDSHCCPEVEVSREVCVSSDSSSHPCSLSECRARELLPVICPHCLKHYCLAHRHQDEHQCERLQEAKPRMAATRELVQRIVDSKKTPPASRGRRGVKSSATAAKVALMKLKLHATGDNTLPQTERLYFQVLLPGEARAASVALFFSTSWSVGRAIDFTAAHAGLPNHNNTHTAKKLRLCHPETGVVLSVDASLRSLLSLPASPLHNGGNIILEYLPNGSLSLDDVTAYTH